MMNIIKATTDPNLFRPYLADKNGKLGSWRNWGVCLQAIYGMPIKPKYAGLVKECTGRSLSSLPKDGFSTVLLLVGRRGGKSKISGLIAAFEAVFSEREKCLSPGEMGLIVVLSPTKLQSNIIKSYIRAAFSSPMLEQEVIREDRWSFQLSNRVTIQILTGDARYSRGFTLLAVICDEVCFFQLSEESRIRSDTELVRAVRPGLATTHGPLILVSTKYSRSGFAYTTWSQCFGNDEATTLVWDASSKKMNPTLSQEIIDKAMEEDPAAARSEYLGMWREDIEAYLPRATVENAVVKGRLQLLPKPNIQYRAFCDTSGGRQDPAALAIGHREDRKIVVDFVKEYKPPFSPYRVAGLMADELNKYRVKVLYGDRYASEYTAEAFRRYGIHYRNSDKSKSELYLELIGPICSGEIELLDNDKLVVQLSNLVRKCRSGGKDVIDHLHGLHDDVANCVAGLAALAGRRKKYAGAWPKSSTDDMRIKNIRHAWARVLSAS